MQENCDLNPNPSNLPEIQEAPDPSPNCTEVPRTARGVDPAYVDHAADVMYVYRRLGVEGLTEKDFPHPGAFALWVWASSHPTQFFTAIVGKAMQTLAKHNELELKERMAREAQERAEAAKLMDAIARKEKQVEKEKKGAAAAADEAGAADEAEFAELLSMGKKPKKQS